MSISAVTSIFSKDKLVNSPLLNQVGIQPVRILLAEMLCKMRANHFNSLLKNEISTLRDDGLLIINDFLPTNEFEAVQKEALNFIEKSDNSTYKKVFGPNTVNAWDISKFSSVSLPNINNFFSNKKLRSILEAGEKRLIKDNNIIRQIEVLKQGAENGEVDGETALHADTFFNTYKAWLYLTDVTLDNGPFSYVKQTNKITLPRLTYEYKNSVAKNKFGSRRVTKEEISKCSLQETIVTCKANTLVIANTFGYHRRLRGTTGNVRIALSCSVRFNPFDILK